MTFSFLEGMRTVVCIVTRSTNFEMQGPLIVSLSLQSILSGTKSALLMCIVYICVSLHIDLCAREEAHHILNVPDIFAWLIDSYKLQQSTTIVEQKLNKNEADDDMFISEISR
jgi:hypothetical protein